METCCKPQSIRRMVDYEIEQAVPPTKLQNIIEKQKSPIN